MSHFCNGHFKSSWKVIVWVITDAEATVATMVGEETPEWMGIVAVVVAGLDKVLIPGTDACMRIIFTVDGCFHDGFFVSRIWHGNEKCAVGEDEVIDGVHIVAVSVTVMGFNIRSEHKSFFHFVVIANLDISR